MPIANIATIFEHLSFWNISIKTGWREYFLLHMNNYKFTQYNAVSFRDILDQVLEKLDLTYTVREPFFTRDLKFQEKLVFYRANQLNTPLFYIYSSICGY